MTYYKWLDREKEKIIKLYVDDRLTAREIASKYGVYSRPILDRLRKWDIKIRGGHKPIKFSNEERKRITDLYTKDLIGSTSIAREYNVSENVILKRLKKWGVEVREDGKLPANHSAFSTINTRSLYWMGYIAGDGCISRAHDRNTYVVSVTSVDREHIKKLKSFLDSQHAISIRASDKYRNRYTFNIRSDDIAHDLINVGITPRKSNTLKVRDDILCNSAFIAGIIDSDGSIYITNKKGKVIPGIQITTGSKKFSCQLSKYLSDYNSTVFKHEYQNENYNDIFTVRIGSIPLMIEFLTQEYLSLPRDVLLGRKREKALEIVNRFGNG